MTTHTSDRDESATVTVTILTKDDVLTVEDAAALDALPIGTLLLDMDGDRTVKLAPTEYLDTTLNDKYDLDDMLSSLPATVENPDIFGSWRDEAPTPTPIKAGDIVCVVTGMFVPDNIKPGDLGKVTRVNTGNSFILVDALDLSFIAFPFAPHEIVKAESVTV